MKSGNTAIQSTGNFPAFKLEIRNRAYEIYERRGKTSGHELDDWLEAETEVLRARVREAIQEMVLGHPPAVRASQSATTMPADQQEG